ncbi:sensor histidine kinase [Pedobacter mucosus]|uniref:sensor histidine kinase n=1 Tax=Pedobacter mucosus TaxID=2895286 RepID=UPI001EE41337|nr:HAMP domain-containing sensor histidine kinase [Pedobacter mucosus]UKT66056.1 HAMP domain-containing histidine kinase [Pedobacter mucosus]
MLKNRNSFFLLCVILFSCNYFSKNEKYPDVKNHVNDPVKYIDHSNPFLIQEQETVAKKNTLVKIAKPQLAKRKNLNGLNTLQQNYKLNLLKKENQLHNLYLIIASIFVSMSILILYQLLQDRKISKKNNAYLTLLNEQIIDQNLRLQKTLNALEQSEKENRRVMKIVAHDLRTPIGAIESVAGLMLDEKRLNSEDEHLINLIKQSASDSLKFVNELLQIDYLSDKLEKESSDLNALLDYCVNLLQYKALEKRQIIILKSVPLIFKFNKEKVWRVISNLVTNAIKFSPNNSTIEVEMKVEANNAIISIKDYGIGIPEEMKEKMFNINKETMRQGTEGEKTYGMGLVISKQIIEAHGGKIWFDSLESKGTTFFAQFPIT